MNCPHAKSVRDENNECAAVSGPLGARLYIPLARCKQCPVAVAIAHHQGLKRKDLTNCAPCKAKLLAAMKVQSAKCKVESEKSSAAEATSAAHFAVSTLHFSVSVVIASLNEVENLVATVASVKGDCPDAEIIVVDDGSTKPEPIAAIRNPKRLGGPRSRRLGALRAAGDVVIFLDAHNALDWETAVWFSRRFPEIGPVKPEFKAMLDRPNKLRTLAAATLNPVLTTTNTTGTTNGRPGAPENPSVVPVVPVVVNPAIVYGGCLFSCGRSGACLVHEKGMLGGRWMRRRADLPKVALWPTSWMLGAFYAIPKTILDRFGGWPALPNYHGAQELAVALLAAAHQVPILYHDGVALWHLFRGDKKGQVKPPYQMDGYNSSHLGYAAAWRLALDDAHWKDARAKLAAGKGPHGVIPEHVLAQVETGEFNRYRADVQSRFKLNADELLAELERRIAADRETRVQGAEDRALNLQRKILLAITFSAEAGTSAGPASLEDKRIILNRCLESARAAGADEIVLCINGGAAAAVHSWPEVSGIPVIPSGNNVGLPLGETRLVRAAIARAVADGYEWVVKVCGDVFHPRPDWAKELVQRAISAPNGAALVTGICGAKCAVTKVFAARTDFLARTWPEDSEVAPQGAGAVLERIWTAKIVRLGLTNLWLPLPSRRAFEGNANWWCPAEPAFSYLHTHSTAGASEWKMQSANCKVQNTDGEKPS